MTYSAHHRSQSICVRACVRVNNILHADLLTSAFFFRLLSSDSTQRSRVSCLILMSDSSVCLTIVITPSVYSQSLTKGRYCRCFTRETLLAVVLRKSFCFKRQNLSISPTRTKESSDNGFLIYRKHKSCLNSQN